MMPPHTFGFTKQMSSTTNAFHIFTPSSSTLPRHASSRAQPLTICMAHPRRVARVAKQIEREVGALLTYDKVMQEAVCPERRRGLDGALSALASVTDVQVSNDLQLAKVYLSIYSDEAGKEAAMVGLQKLEGYVRKHVGRQVRLRLTPEIRFVRDDSIERAERVLALLEQVKKIESGEAPPPPIVIPEDEEEEEYYEDDDEEEGVVVDLGFFDDGEEEEDAVVVVAGNNNTVRKSNNNSGRKATHNGKVDGGVGSDEVEEMMRYFGQGGGGKNKQSGGRKNSSRR